METESNSKAVKEIKDYKEELNWFLDNYRSLQIKHPDLYVGVQDKEVKVAKKTIEEVKEGVDTDRVYLLKYIPLEDEPKVLNKKLANMGLEEYGERLKKIDEGNMQGY